MTKGRRTQRNVLRVFLVYAFVFNVGAVGFLFGFIPHVFFADQAAELIGWPNGSMFQFEVGLRDGGWGILGSLCVFFGGGFWLATAVGYAFFMLGAALGHIREIIVEGYLAPPYNLRVTDTFIPLYLLGLLYACWRAGVLAAITRRSVLMTSRELHICPRSATESGGMWLRLGQHGESLTVGRSVTGDRQLRRWAPSPSLPVCPFLSGC